MLDSTVPVIDYTRYSNRQLAAAPLALLVLSLLIIVGMWAVTGTPVDPGIDFTGGTEVQLQTDASQTEIAAAFESEPASIQSIATGQGEYIVTLQSTDTAAIEQQATDAGFTVTSISSTSAAFGSETQTQALVGVAIAFVGMSVLVALMFRTFVPSIAVVLSAFSDIAIPVALMNLFGIQLSLGTVAALLMLIGYSVDSDLLLNNHVLRRRGDFYQSTHRAMRTGVTMTVTSLVAMVVMTTVATLFAIPLLPEIGLVLVFGLLADLMNTYLLNVSLLRWYKYEGIAR
ncbi:protein translocase subunit SecF [Halalkalicoccus jeotgali]|uniref:Protein-export membrane protein SecF n=1 Tax=Halalkalicoccus jeotgali (strain DSM 18796 / CECT 7217 / JCM 14584 / KCTC 4019 / B3) TaxID=795797 RepID=D8J8Y0_HALJB|nr:protein translocase subunit SecF [Halalkalicoccus jeotgali]ADJ14315.1 preprotein translocase subunit SecF [Halalkalicoccus jeotgali B3]ELY40578.1 preprotein translocase subunit SecF [Halalkalicoccus jeotgali B3]